MRYELWTDGKLVEQHDIPDHSAQPLDAVGSLATLLAVQQVVSVEDAANAVGLAPAQLVAEAQAWAAAGDMPTA